MNAKPASLKTADVITTAMSASSAVVPNAKDLDTHATLASLLTKVARFVRRYVMLASRHQLIAVSLWVVHTHTVDAAEVSPYLAITSAEKQSGKSRLLEVLELLVAKPWRVVWPTEAVLFRKITKDHPTLLLDEVDAIFGDKTGTHEGIRAVLNAGHRRGAKVSRCVGEASSVEEFVVFGPKVLAGIGNLPDTVADRSIPIRLKRRAPHETVARFRLREAIEEAVPLRAALSAWATEHIEVLCASQPQVPTLLNDRAAEGWEPLLAIAEAAGGRWPTYARAAAEALHRDPVHEETYGLVLLRAIRSIFNKRSVDRITTKELLTELIKRADEPWGEWWGKAIREEDTRGPGYRLSKLLRPFEISARPIDVNGTKHRGFRRADFEDAFSRYLPQKAETM